VANEPQRKSPKLENKIQQEVHRTAGVAHLFSCSNNERFGHVGRFDCLDKDGSGEIDSSELSHPLLCTGLARSALEVGHLVRCTRCTVCHGMLLGGCLKLACITPSRLLL